MQYNTFFLSFLIFHSLYSSNCAWCCKNFTHPRLKIFAHDQRERKYREKKLNPLINSTRTMSAIDSIRRQNVCVCVCEEWMSREIDVENIGKNIYCRMNCVQRMRNHCSFKWTQQQQQQQKPQWIIVFVYGECFVWESIAFRYITIFCALCIVHRLISSAFASSKVQRTTTEQKAMFTHCNHSLLIIDFSASHHCFIFAVHTKTC